jgi:hypothetical protein
LSRLYGNPVDSPPHDLCLALDSPVQPPSARPPASCRAAATPPPRLASPHPPRTRPHRSRSSPCVVTRSGSSTAASSASLSTCYAILITFSSNGASLVAAAAPHPAAGAALPGPPCRA